MQAPVMFESAIPANAVNATLEFQLQQASQEQSTDKCIGTSI